MLMVSSSFVSRSRPAIHAPQGRRAHAGRARRARALFASEHARLRAHFRKVLAELRARDVAHLSAPQRAMRARLIGELGRYARAGRFPRNLDFPNARMPYFIDAFGTRCAMAHLVSSTGAEELVARVASTKNNAFVRELASEPELLAWLDRAGLTAAEAARIQPSYCYLTKADACFCEKYSPELPVPERALLEVTVIKSSPDSLRVGRVDVVHGNAAAAMVGQEVKLWTGGWGKGEVGDTMLVGVRELPIVDMLYSPYRIAKDGTVEPQCGLDVPNLNKADVITALLTPNMSVESGHSACSSQLAAMDAMWGESQCAQPIEMPPEVIAVPAGECLGSDGKIQQCPDSSSAMAGGGCSLAAPSASSPLVLGAVALAAMWARRRGRSA